MGLRINSSRRAIAIWSTVAAVLGIAILQPSAYGLEFPATTSLTLSSADLSDGLTREEPSTSEIDVQTAPIETALFRCLWFPRQVPALSLPAPPRALAKLPKN
jgi:hypothetical protein